ncbi:MAG TPA: hypothetical protein VEK33_23325, partial [Terriglobales bacterium]|nr:hypothetical protein [Terriglobales bacterium]
MSSLPNPFSDPDPAFPGMDVLPPPENPLWSGWDVVGITAVTVVLLIVIPLLVVLPAHLLVYPKLSLMDIMQIPDVVLLVQLLIYLAVLGLIYSLLKGRSGAFWKPIGWNWPT